MRIRVKQKKRMRIIKIFIMAFMATTSFAQNIIDVHSHIITQEFVSALEKEGRLLDEGFPLPKWDAEAHLRWMDEAGIQTSVLTLAAPQPQETHPQPLPVMEGSGYLQDKDSTECLFTPLHYREGQGGGSLVRLAEIEVHPQYLTEYLAAAKEIQHESLKSEPGVLCLFPSQLKEDDGEHQSSETQIRILEIYASQEAYQHHIQTAHFQKYKQGTLHMVKSLKLQDLSPLSTETMYKIFKRKQ